MAGDILTLLQNAHIDYRTADSSRDVRTGYVGLSCPYCRHAGFYLGIQISSGRCSCWQCGPKNVVKTLLALGISFEDAIALWKGQRSATSDNVEHRGRLKLPKGVGDLLPIHKQYLRRRGFDPEALALQWGIGGIGLHPRLPWRVFIPIHDPGGRVVSWTTRSVRRNAPVRYISASPEEEAVPHKTLLYGSHLAHHAVVVVEGPADAWAVGPGSVATFGLNWSKAQLAAVSQYPLRVVLMDSEPVAQRRAERLCRQLSCFPGTTEQVELESGNDPGSADPEEIAEIRQKYLESGDVSPAAVGT